MYDGKEYFKFHIHQSSWEQKSLIDFCKSEFYRPIQYQRYQLNQRSYRVNLGVIISKFLASAITLLIYFWFANSKYHFKLMR